MDGGPEENMQHEYRIPFMSEDAASDNCGCSRLHRTTVADTDTRNITVCPPSNMVAQLMMSVQSQTTRRSNTDPRTSCSTERQTACGTGNRSRPRTCRAFALTGRQGSLRGTRRKLSRYTELNDSVEET